MINIGYTQTSACQTSQASCFPCLLKIHKALELNMELDVLEFWHGSSMRYPELSLMARDLLTIPVSTVASESAFSLGGKTISPTRSALKPKTVQALVCLQDWRRADYDATLVVDNDSNSDEEGAYEDEEDSTSLFF